MSPAGALALALLLMAGPALAQDKAPRSEATQNEAPLRAALATRASPALQDEIRPRALAAAAAKLGDPSCRQVAVAQTSFNGWTGSVGSPLGEALGESWEETWVIDVCGRIVDVLVRLAPPRVDIPSESVHLRP